MFTYTLYIIIPFSFYFVLAFSAIVMGETDVVDSLLIKNHYTQNGKLLKRRNMEKMLLNIDDAGPYIKRAKGCRVASNLIGFSLWGVSLGITISQLVSTIKAVEEEKPITTEFDKFMLPLSIGGEISSLFQSRLMAQSGYLTRKGVVAFNNHLCKERGLDIQYDHHINKSKQRKMWYIQDGVDMSTGTLYYVLREHPASKESAIMSLVWQETATRTAGVGMTFLVIAIIGSLEGEMNKGYLATGISTTTFSICTAIASMVSRKRAIRKYNKAVPAKIPCGQGPQ